MTYILSSPPLPPKPSNQFTLQCWMGFPLCCLFLGTLILQLYFPLGTVGNSSTQAVSHGRITSQAKRHLRPHSACRCAHFSQDCPAGILRCRNAPEDDTDIRPQCGCCCCLPRPPATVLGYQVIIVHNCCLVICSCHRTLIPAQMEEPFLKVDMPK